MHEIKLQIMHFSIYRHQIAENISIFKNSQISICENMFVSFVYFSYKYYEYYIKNVITEIQTFQMCRLQSTNANSYFK